uniref:Uncharacterized protein n=1 Tax=Acrobeloides nanus TaxID=290746 RepID=A0A914EGF7_9BILA
MKTTIAFLLVVALIAITIDAATPKEEHVNSRMKKGAPIEDSIGARVTRQLNCCQDCQGCAGSFSNSRDDGCPVGQIESLC